MSKLAWPAVRALARHELRRRWRALLLLGLVAGVLAGTALGITTALWRTTTAYDRLVDATRLDDVRVSITTATSVSAEHAQLVAAQRRAAVKLAKASAVIAAQDLSLQLGRVRAPGIVYASVLAVHRPTGRFALPVVIAGHRPDPASVSDVMLEQNAAAQSNVTVGDVVRLDLLTPRQYADFSTGVGTPDGPTVELHVVGIFRYPKPLSAFETFLATPAFYAAQARSAVGAVELLGTRHHAGAGSGDNSIGGIAQDLEQDLQSRSSSSTQTFVTVDEPRHRADPAVGSTRGVLRAGLLALVVAVAVAGIILVGQLVGGWAERGRAGQEIERELGLRPGERVLARLLTALPPIMLAAALAALGGLVGGLREPVGALAAYEPNPGWLPQWPIVAGGAAVVLFGTAGIVAVTTACAGRPPRPRPRWKRSRWRRSPRRRVPLLSASVSTGRGGPSTGVAMRSTVVGLAAVLAVLVVVDDVHQQLAGLRDRPAAWGWTADFAVADDTARLDASLQHDARVRDLEQVTDAPVLVQRANGRQLDVTGYGRATLRGSLPWLIAAGRLPRTDGEVTLGVRLAHDLSAAVGDTLSFLGRQQPLLMRVVGIAVLPAREGELLGRNALFTPAGLRSAAGAVGDSAVLVRATDAGAQHALRDELAREYQLTAPDPPPSITAIDELGTATYVLLLVLLLAAMLLVTQQVRLLLRRHRSQLAILDAMGLPPQEIVGAATASVVLASLLAAVVGGALGWAVSRIVLVEIAPRLGVELAPPSVLTAVLAAAALLGLTALVSAVTTAAWTGRNPVWRDGLDG